MEDKEWGVAWLMGKEGLFNGGRLSSNEQILFLKDIQLRFGLIE